jgi:signal recognition particle receptor subunit beta
MLKQSSLLRMQVQYHVTALLSLSMKPHFSLIRVILTRFVRHLHHILHALTSLPPSQKLPKLLILAHKSDFLKSGSSSAATSSTLAVNRVKSILERELEKRRASQSGGVGVEGLGAEGERSDMGGLECSGPGGGTFRFTEWEGGDIEFIGTFVKVGSVAGDEKGGDVHGLGALWEWLHEIL